MLLLKKLEERWKRNKEDVFLVYRDNAISYEESFKIINEYRKVIRPCLDKLLGIKIKRGPELIFAIIACMYEGKAFLITNYDIQKKREEYLLGNAGIRTCIQIENNKLKLMSSNIIIKNNYSYANIAQVIYTSGSTGMPKGVMLSKENYNNFFNEMSSNYDFSKSHGFLILSNVEFDMFMSEILIAVAKDKIIYLVGQENLRDVSYIVNLINKYNINNILTTPSKINTFFYDSNFKVDILKNVLLGGEKLDKSIVLKFDLEKTNVYNLYGPTEATFHCIRYKIENYNQIFLGNPVENSDVFVLEDNGNVAKYGMGQLMITGNCVSDGYIGIENKDFRIYNGKKAFVTGDIVNINPNGNITYIDRDSSILKINGQRISLEEIEKSIKGVVPVSFVKVLSHNKTLIALCISDEKLDTHEIKEKLMDYVPQYMIPNNIYQISEQYLTSNDKFDYKRHIEELEKSNFSKPAKSSPVIKVIEKTIGRSVDLSKSFKENGGDSLSAMRIIVELRNEKLNVKKLLSNASLCEILSHEPEEIINDTVYELDNYNLTPMQKYISYTNENFEDFVTNSYLELRDNTTIQEISGLFCNLKKKYDGLCMYLSKECNKLLYSNNYKVSISEHKLDSINNNKLQEIYDSEKVNCTTGKDKTMHLVFINSEDKKGLIVIIHHFFSDALSWNLIYKEVECFNNKCGMNYISKNSNSYRKYLQDLELFLNKNQLDEDLFPDLFLSNKYNNKPYVLIRDFSMLSKSIQISEQIREKDFYTSVIFAITKILNVDHAVYEIENNGRVFERSSFYEAIGWFTAPFDIELKYNITETREYNIDSISSKVKKYSEKSVQLSNKRVNQIKKNDTVLSAPYVLNFIGNIGNVVENTIFSDAPNLNAYFDLYFVGYIMDDILNVEVKYNIKKYDVDTIEQLLVNIKMFLMQK